MRTKPTIEYWKWRAVFSMTVVGAIITIPCLLWLLTIDVLLVAIPLVPICFGLIAAEVVLYCDWRIFNGSYSLMGRLARRDVAHSCLEMPQIPDRLVMGDTFCGRIVFDARVVVSEQGIVLLFPFVGRCFIARVQFVAMQRRSDGRIRLVHNSPEIMTPITFSRTVGQAAATYFAMGEEP